jgi:CMP-N,N'-diacetyllegionaminic acid synthase
VNNSEEKNNLICVIPARGGSKGIARKNLVNLGGKKLLAWTIEAALKSEMFDRVIVSTEDEEIADAAKDLGAEVPFIRPSSLASDEVHAVHVIFHTLDWIYNNDNSTPDGVMMLLPTSPFRSYVDIRNSVEIFNSGHDAVIGVVDLGKYMTNLRYMDKNTLKVVSDDEDLMTKIKLNTQRQGLKKIYSVNGAIFLAKTDLLRSNGTFHMDGAKGYVMSVINSIDINSPEDLKLSHLYAKFESGK